MERRLVVQLGGRPVVLEDNHGLMIYFHRRDATTVAMDLVVDSTDLPDWFVQPTGTWFELLEIE